MAKRMDLEEAEVNYIMGLLTERPWRESNGLIQKIVAQMNNAEMQGELEELRLRAKELKQELMQPRPKPEPSN